VTATLKSTFDAIVVGSGITGGWAAKELTERGLETLVVERGRHLEHGTSYTTEHLPPYSFRYRLLGDRRRYRRDYAVQSRSLWMDEASEQFWVNDRDHPYTTPANKPFNWYRGYHLGGRSLLWGRQSYRMSALNFLENERDGHGCDWPIRYEDLAPWYSHVERFIGVSGEKLGCAASPDGEYQPPMPMNAVERQFAARVAERFPERRVTIARAANLTQPIGPRMPCHYCEYCRRGCSPGAYFSSLSSTLPAAQATGRLTIATDTIVHSVIYESRTRRVAGVRVIDAKTHAVREYRGRLVVLCASAFESVRVLLNSATPDFPDGFANSSGTLGRYVMDHHPGNFVIGEIDGPPVANFSGGRPIPLHIPRFRNLGGERKDYVRGFQVVAAAYPIGWQRGLFISGVGAPFKQALRQRGRWSLFCIGQGDALPSADNRVSLDPVVKDAWGIPALHVDVSFGPNEAAMRPDMTSCAEEMVRAAGCDKVRVNEVPATPGEAIHEMGGARMGRDPKTSVLNAWNQAHDVPNLLVTDGAAMASSSSANPSLTYMALTARACAHAVELMKRKEL
jgi:choline dehydrogenase-like flavoprotein